MKIVNSACAKVPTDEWARLEALAEHEFMRYEIVRETTWAEPDWNYRAYEDGELAVFYNLILRTVYVDGAAVRVAGLNNMITLEAFRGRGLASALLRETQPRWADVHRADCGLLLCADALLPFYSKLGWRKLDARVRFAQPSGSATWMANCMVLDPGGSIGEPREVDLGGLPW